MSFIFTKIVVAALAVGAAQAYPNAPYALTPTTFSTLVAPSSTSSVSHPSMLAYSGVAANSTRSVMPYSTGIANSTMPGYSRIILPSSSAAASSKGAYNSVAAVSSTSIAAAPIATPVDNTALIIELETAPTAIKRFQRLLTAAGEKLLSVADLQKFVVFDFNGAVPAPGSKGGAAKAANIETFPILTELGISTTVAFLGPCGMNSPHIHPRATEFLTVVEGEIDFGFILENGLVNAPNPSEITGHLTKFQGTVFPLGSIHYQVNPTCAPATFVATLNSDDPGTSQIAQNFFGLNSGVVNATLGFPQTLNGEDLETFRKAIPANLALGIETCLKKCGIAKR